MSSFQKPLYISDVFNTSLYDFDESNELTIYEGDRRYLKLSGGIVNGLTTFNNSLNVNGSLSINGSAIDLSLISGVVAGTPQNSKALSLDSSGNLNGVLSISTPLQNALQITNTSASSRANIRFITTTRSCEMGLRGASDSDPNSFYIYDNTASAFRVKLTSAGDFNVITSISTPSITATSITGTLQTASQSNITSLGTLTGLSINGNVGIGTTSPGFPLEVNGQAQMTNISLTSTTDATSVSTGSLTTLGGISAAKTIYGKQLVADAFGSHLTLKNGANAYVLQSSQSDGILTFICTYNASNYAQYQFASCSPGTSGSGANYKGQISVGGLVRANDGHRLDFGSTAQDNIICLFQQNNVSATYMIGANNSSVNITSAGSNGVKLTYSNATGLAAPATIGTTIFHAKGNGNCITTSNLISNTGLHSYGIDSTDLSSYPAGAHIHYAASKASFFGYDYSGGVYKDLSLNNDNLYIKSSNGYIGIQQTSPVCPLHVSTTANQTTASSFGFLSSSGSGTATGFTNRAFSIRSDGGIYIVTGEIDCTSDIRFKKDIINISDDLALDFITKIKPIQFSYKNAENNLHYGYSAQELVKNKFNVLVGSTQTDEPIDKQILINDRGESITIPSDTKLVVNLLATIPLLHRALQLSNNRITDLENNIEELRALLDTKANSRKKRI